MAQLDRFFNLLVTNNATALVLSEGDVATVTIKDAAHPVMKQALTSAQILTLVREIAPPGQPHALDAQGGVRFEYSFGDGTFEVVLTQNGKIAARIEPKAASSNGGKQNRTPAPAATPQVSAPPSAAQQPSRTQAPGATTPVQTPQSASTGNRALDRVENLLRALVGNNASDLHLRAGSPPMLRASGEIVPLPNEAVLSSDDIDAMLHAVM